MTSNHIPQGFDLLTDMVSAATQSAADHLGGAVRLMHCHDIDIRQDTFGKTVDIESWPVRREAGAVTISVVATRAARPHGVSLAGSARLVFKAA